MIAREIPPGLRIVPAARQYRLLCTRPGTYRLQLELVARITRSEPWNQISFLGPETAIARVTAAAGATGVEMQLLNGTQIDATPKAMSRLSGFLGPDRQLSMRWQSRTAEVARKSLVTVDTTAIAQITPTVVKFNTRFRYEILQAPVSRLTIRLPSSHALTKVQGEQIRDWSAKQEGDHQLLTVELARPIEKSYVLTLLSEQPVEVAPATAQLMPAQPLDIEREAGSFTFGAEDMLVDIDSVSGLRQVNTTAGMLAAYRFHGRPIALAAKLKPIEPLVKVHDRVTARLDETRLLLQHGLSVTVEKSGIYFLELTPQAGFTVADVRGEGVEDWKVAAGKLRVNFAAKILGARRLEVQLEQAIKTLPDPFAIAPLPVAGASAETAQIGASSGPGIRLKTAGDLSGLREIPVTALSSRTDEALAFAADSGPWQLTLSAERLPGRIMADIFNLVTVGDGLIGGSAVVRYGILNQGTQELRVKLPAHWKNVEFTGPNIRRKETNAPAADGTNFVTWSIFLQDKAWGGYTLVVTYDYQFDPRKAALDLAGAHAVGVERETGSVALTTAASLQLTPRPTAQPLLVIDPSELAETDRTLITRPVLLAWRYAGDAFTLVADVTRHDEARDLLNAVADRTQITSVLTDEGQMLSQAGFMVKNNDKQFQRLRLPAGASLWACYVNNQPVKAEQDGDGLLVSLPRGANRDEAFAVDIVYKQTLAALKSGLLPRSLELVAPRTDVPNTYAEWQLYVPDSRRLSRFAGTMAVQRGTTYDLRDAWGRVTGFYGALLRDHGAWILLVGGGAIVLISLLFAGLRKGRAGIMTVVATISIVSILVAMLLPSLGTAKARAQRVTSLSNLKQIGLAAIQFANDNGGVLPSSFEEMHKDLGSERVLRDTSSGERFIYVGAGKRFGDPNLVLAYSPTDVQGRAVCFADGRVEHLTSGQFAEAMQRDAEAQLSSRGVAVNLDQSAAINRMQALTGPSAMVNGGQGGAVQRGQIAGGFPGVAGALNMPAASPPAAVDPATGLPVATQPAAPVPAPAAPIAAGIRSIRIDIPRTGQMFTFTKVLNISDEPLSLQLSIMKLATYRALCSGLQLVFFVAGLIVVWREWRRAPRRSFALTLGLACILGSVSSLGLSLRTLHLWLIALVPILLAFVTIRLLVRFWPVRVAKAAPEPEPPSTESSPSPGIPPALAGIVLFFSIGLWTAMTARAQNPGDSSSFIRPSSFSNSLTVLSANYTGAVREKVAQFDATLLLSSVASNQTLALFGDDVAVEEFSSDANEAKLLRHGREVALRLGAPGNARVQVKFAVKLGGDAAKRQLAFAIPPALSSRLDVSIDESEADVEFPTAVSFQRTPRQDETRVEAILGAGDRVEMQWTPRLKRITEMAASIFAQNTILVSIGGGVVNTRAVVDYQITQGELRQAKLRLPAGQRLLRVDGLWIRTWELNDEGGAQMLTVDLIKGVTPNYQLTVEMEKSLDPVPASVKIETPHVQDVIRESGLLAVSGGEELGISIESAQDLQRVDAGEFARNSALQGENLAGAYRFFKPGFSLILRAESIQPQVEATVRNAFHIGFDEIALQASVDYTVKKAGLFTVRLAVPDGYRVESLGVRFKSRPPLVSNNALSAGPAQQELPWVEKANPRVIEVTLKERTLGAFSLALSLKRTQKEPPKDIALTGIAPLDVQKLTGTIAVTSEPGIALKTAGFDGLTEIPAGTAALDNGAAASAPASRTAVLAFKSTGADPASAAAWKLSLATETVESWIRSEVVNIVTVTETLVSGRALVRYDIQNAPVKEFRLRVPTNYINVEVNGPNIRRRDPGAEYRVELQNKVRGTYTLTLTWEQPRVARTTNSGPDLLPFTGIEAVGVERETGEIVFLARPPLQVTEKSAPDPLVRIDTRELPSWAGVTQTASGAGEAPVLVYRYLRPGYQAVLETSRFGEAAVLQALVDSARLTTVVADDGQMMTEMTLNIRNNGLQHLEIELPSGAKVWSAFVAGQPVRPTTRGTRWLLPLERSGVDDAPVTLELTFVGSQKFPRGKGGVKLESPKLDVPLKNARWDVYLPPDYQYGRFDGSMKHEADAAPVVQVYSSSDYVKQEREKKAAKSVEFWNSVSNARKSLTQGKLNGAYNELLNASTANPNSVGTENSEIEGLNRELNRSQAGNLINAQRAYFATNFQRYAGKGTVSEPPAQQAVPQPAEQGQYDTEVAEQQWGALQRSQEITFARVQPLRANLPTRGQRHSFSQVLQTEISRPMTIEFHAANAREVGWFQRGLSWIGGFMMLWIFTAVVIRRPATPPPLEAGA